MKGQLLLAVALAAGVNAGVIDPRQRPRPTSRPGPGGGGSTPPDVSQCGLDAFTGHTSEALLFCSSLLRSGTAIQTVTTTTGQTTTVQTTVYTTLYPPTSTPLPPTSKPPTSTPRPTSTPKPPTSTPKPPSSTPITSSPGPTPSQGCGIVGYTGAIAAYYFDSSGTKNTFAACSAACKADTKCKSFGYGEANCLLFDVNAAANTNYNPMSPYTFYDAGCPSELPVKKRQIGITLGLGSPSGLSSACSCLITSGPAGETKTTSVTITNKATSTQTVTRIVSLLPDSP